MVGGIFALAAAESLVGCAGGVRDDACTSAIGSCGDWFYLFLFATASKAGGWSRTMAGQQQMAVPRQARRSGRPLSSSRGWSGCGN